MRIVKNESGIAQTRTMPLGKNLAQDQRCGGGPDLNRAEADVHDLDYVDARLSHVLVDHRESGGVISCAEYRA